MAAYAALVSLTRTINLILQNHHHSIFFHEYSQEVSHLLEQSALLQAFLEEGDHGLQARITDVANEAEDVIQDFLSTQIQSRLNSARRSQDFQLQRHQDSVSDVYQKLQKVTKGMDSVVGQVMKSAKDSSEGKDLLKHRDFSSASSSSGLLVPAAGKDVVVGFEDDLTAIKHRLCGQNSKLQVVPIFGMGGIGKTTLARNAYYDQLIMEHFQIRAWVKISQDYSIQEIISNLLVSIEPSDENERNQSLEEKVYKGLKGMRYLIVLDDMWSTKAWDEVKMILPDDDNGSRIIMTTRLLDVASLEEEAEECLEDLVKRSLVLVTKRKTDGKIKICSVHDLVRDLCIRKAEEDNFLHRNSSPTYSEFCSFIRDFRLLKILDVAYSSSVHLFPEVYELCHLRYLAVDYHTEIPAAISNLRHLQTLILHQEKALKSYGPWMIRLPSAIWMVSQLRHLVSFVFGRLPDPEGGTSPLENLQTLSDIRDFRCTEKILKMLPNLKKLGISYIIGQNDQDYHLENLLNFHQLQKLKVKIYPSFLFRWKLNPVFPPSLKKLSLSGWHRAWEDMGIVGSLPNLEVLKLRDYAFRGYKWETNEEEFRCLKFLLIDKSDLQHWITENSHFPNLKCLVLYRCWCLKEIPDGFGEIPTLELIKVDDGNISVMDSTRQIQEIQQGWGNDAFQIRIGRYNTSTGEI
ncbi:UNVERIFIED_CONTAM: Disease resistance protein RPP13 [Sesamum angustifolium]|uniref:Disease resistance protein RPP13 n=1 Tax=Sesamum angustifolium TaxID=2727405 RepID=A0AAW2NKQ7_9LAMI